MDRPKLATILLVEDNRVDVMAVERAFRKEKLLNDLVVASDGIEALELLRGTTERPPLDGPLLILLDLNMPRMNGLEFLDELRNDPKLHTMVVFVLTTSKLEEDRLRSYEMHIAGYLHKDSLGPDFVRLVELLGAYHRAVILP